MFKRAEIAIITHFWVDKCKISDSNKDFDIFNSFNWSKTTDIVSALEKNHSGILATSPFDADSRFQKGT